MDNQYIKTNNMIIMYWWLSNLVNVYHCLSMVDYHVLVNTEQ